MEQPQPVINVMAPAVGDSSSNNVAATQMGDGNNAQPDADNPHGQYGRVVILLENPILPDEMVQNTPSKADGLAENIEHDLRITGCKLIQISGILLRLPQVAMATGQVLFQRFYYSKSFVRLPMEITAMACVVLASKVEEAPRRIRDVMNVFHNMKQIRLEQPVTSMMLDEKYVSLKNQVIKAERRILKELGFCVHVKHPHKFIVAVAKTLRNEDNTELIQAAWSYMNDSLRTNVFVRFSPETIACACIHLSARILKVPLPTKPAWYEIFNIDTDTIETVCQDVLSLYTRKTLPQEKLEEQVEIARQLRIENKAAVELKKLQKQQQEQKIAEETETMEVLKPIETQPISDHSSISSPASFKLQKSPPNVKKPEPPPVVIVTAPAVKSAVSLVNDESEKMDDDYNSHRHKNGHHHSDDSPSNHHHHTSDGGVKERTIRKSVERTPPRSYILPAAPRTPLSDENERSPRSDREYRKKDRSSAHYSYHYRSSDYDSKSSRSRYYPDYDDQHRSSSRRYEERQSRSSGDYYQKRKPRSRSRSRSPNNSNNYSQSSSRYVTSQHHYHHHHRSSRH